MPFHSWLGPLTNSAFENRASAVECPGSSPRAVTYGAYDSYYYVRRHIDICYCCFSYFDSNNSYLHRLYGKFGSPQMTSLCMSEEEVFAFES